MLLQHDDNGRGPVVVLLHGFPFDRSMWASQVEALSDQYRLIVPDLRGHGSSPAPDDRVYTIDAMADDLIETLNALNLHEKVVLGGLSMGGYIALSAITRYPDRFMGLMLLDTKATSDPPEIARGRGITAEQVESSGNTETLVEGLILRVFAQETREHKPELVESLRKVMKSTSPRTIAASLRGMAARPDRMDDLARIQLPTLILVGADDVVTPVSDAKAMAERLPNAKLAVITDSGHLAPLENPEASNTEILSYLKEL